MDKKKPISHAKVARGRGFKVTKSTSGKKSGTVTTKNHRFQSFSQRIAKFNVDPIRRAQGRTYVHQQHEASHFVTAFAEWKDLNMSENFTAFVKEVEPLCYNLPQVLHYEAQIMDSLIRYIKKDDALCLEPLLSLVAHFAHDLGARFEVHFQVVVAAVNNLAATHPDVEVIEWSFTCLAWLFKYLSRLLVPDLRPLYDLMAPLLGKHHQKSFVTKFAAEAMSFLIRKAGAMSHKNESPLRHIIDYAFADLSDTPQDQIVQYEQGLTVLFAEAIRGVQNGIHSSGTNIIRSLLSSLFRAAENGAVNINVIQYTVECILVDIIHNTDSEGFAPVLDAIIEFHDHFTDQLHDQWLRIPSRILFIVMGTRKGSRVSNWSSVLERISKLLDAVKLDGVPLDLTTLYTILKTVAIAMCYAPFEQIVPTTQEYLAKIQGQIWDHVFLSFCTFCAEINLERFDMLVLPAMQKFIVARWDSYEAQLCFLLPQFGASKAINVKKIALPQAWQERMVEKFKTLAAILADPGAADHGLDPQASALMALCNSYLDVAGIFGLDKSFGDSFRLVLVQVIQLTAISATDTSFHSSFAAFGMSKILSYVAESSISASTAVSLLGSALKVSPLHSQRPLYLKGILQLIRLSDLPPAIEAPETKALLYNLVENLASSSHELRLLSLETLCELHGDTPDGLNAALSLEMSSFSLESARPATLLIRRIVSTFESFTGTEIVKRAFPAYCFGLLHVRLASIWEDACNALKSMSNVKGSGEDIMHRAISWLVIDESSQDVTNRSDEDLQSLTNERVYDCSNLMALDSIAFRSSVETDSAERQLHQRMITDTHILSRNDLSSRSRSLRVLNAIPRLAERKSRALVPVLLQWALDSDSANLDDEELCEVIQSPSQVQNFVTTPDRWSRKEQKELLKLFAQFVNPTVLHRSEAVYDALLNLLCNGDVEIQQSALKAIFAWNLPSIKPYEEHLTNILDDARLREEIAIFLNVDENDSEIRLEHHAGLMPVLLRLLYGRIVSRSGSSSTRGTQQAKRKAVLMSLFRFGNRILSDFVGIALGPLDHVRILDGTQLDEVLLAKNISTLRKQVGMLKMLNDTLQVLSDLVSPFVDRLNNAILYCLILVNRELKRKPGSGDQSSSATITQNVSLLKDARQEGLNCLNLLCKACPEFEWTTYAPVIMQEIVEPRLDKLPIESAQSVSGLLKLFSTWSTAVPTVSLLVQPDLAVIRSIGDCLVEPSSKDEVKIYILKNIIETFLDQTLSSAVIKPGAANTSNHVSIDLQQGLGYSLLERVSKMLRYTSNRECLETGIRIVVRLSIYAKKTFDVKALLEISLHLLRQPARLVNPRLKSEILGLLRRFVPSYDFAADNDFWKNSLKVISSLFSYFRDGHNRNLLVIVYSQLAKCDSKLIGVAELCQKLNACSSARLDEPDFEQRLQAFQMINDEKFAEFTIEQWQPIIYNMLFLIKDNDELSIRTSASLSLRRFIQTTNFTSDVSIDSKSFFIEAILPEIQSGMREPSELVRAEYVAVLAELVKSNWFAVHDMKCLFGSDEESSFFNNILHIQQHRRVRALKRLAIDSATISSINISRFCLPLIENFFGSVEDGLQNTAPEAIHTLESLAEGLEWQAYRALLQRSVNDAAKLDSKLHIRALAAIVNALSRAFSRQTPSEFEPKDQGTGTNGGITLSNLARTLPDQASLSKSLSNSVFAKLTDLIHYKDESTVDLRVLIAVIAVKVAMVFPAQQIEQSMPSILMDICNILKSKAQEARDIVRKTLADISFIVGPRYFGFIIKQLRAVLQRGSHLHVLSYTVHQILVSVSPNFKPGDIDYCLGDLMGVIMNDIFGATSQEKEAQDYVSKMREVRKKTLSYDSLELLATITTLPHVLNLLRPIKEQLEKPRTKPEKIDELLRRLREGLRRNKTVKDRDFLTLSFEILKEAYQSPDFSSNQVDLTSHKMASFALELLRRVLDKHEDLKTAENLAGFIPVLRKTMADEVEEVQMSAMRLVTSIIKVPLKEIDENAKVFIRRSTSLIDGSASTNAPIAQAALRLISAILRERPNANISKGDFDNNIAYLLTRIKPDLQEPARQGDRDRQVAAFNFLKAVVGRKEPVNEAYQVMDVVREVMITSQEHPIPDLARSVYSRFVLDYFPVEMKGFSKQLDFLTSNLQYPHPRGRLSVMEVIMFLMTRKSGLAVQSILMTFFLPLLVVLATDTDEQCRQSAHLLLRKILERADKDHSKTLQSQMLKWFEEDTDALWKKVGFQCWKIYFDIHTDANKAASLVFAEVAKTIENAAVLDSTTASTQILHSALDLLRKLCENYPGFTFGVNTSGLWSSITRLLTNDSKDIRSTSSSLINTYFADFARTTAKLDGRPQTIPLVGSGGLELTVREASTIVKSSMKTLQAENDDGIITQVVQNIAFIGRMSAGGNSQDLLDQLFRQASSVIRIEGDGRPPRAKLAALKLIVALSRLVKPENIQPTLEDILLPLHNLTDSAIPATSSSSDPTYAAVQEELLMLAQEQLDALQAKMGTTIFIYAMQEVQRGVKERREDRRSKRRIEAVSAPEKAGREKQKKNEMKRSKRRDKNALAAGRRRGW